MKSYDNNRKLVSDISHFRTGEGKSVTTNTMYNTHSGQVASQNVSVQDSKTGKVSTTTTIGGKLLP
jgi:translation elongation factor P/translation initiation factor 5A